jgi:acetyl-CoA acetyltransferase
MPRELGVDDSIVNVLGSGCSHGHPVAMTGARMMEVPATRGE